MCETKSMRLDGCHEFEDGNYEKHLYTGRDVVHSFFELCGCRGDIPFTMLESFCNCTGYYNTYGYFGSSFCTEWYEDVIREKDQDPYMRWRIANRAPEVIMEYFGEEGVEVYIYDLEYWDYNIFLTYDEFFQVVKEEYAYLTREDSPRSKKASSLLHRLERRLEEAKNSKLGFSMTRREGLEIIQREGLECHNIDGMREYKPGDRVIEEEDGLWHVYYVNEAGTRYEGYNRFILEEEAWAFFIAWLREEEKGRSGPPLTRQEAEEIIRREGLRNNRMLEDGSLLEEKAVVIRKEGGLWQVYNTDEEVRAGKRGHASCTKDRSFIREEDAWASYVERLWIEASRHRFIRQELGLEET